ncbi:MAG: sensor histidine kinase [Elainellaceae cyanobacterium]
MIWDEGEWVAPLSMSLSDGVWLTLALLAFGAMGLRLPVAQWAKMVYVAIAFSLIGVIASIQWAIDPLSPLLIIVVLRSCLLFGQGGRWAIASITWLVYPFTIAPILLILWIALDPRWRTSWSIDRLPDGVVITPGGGLQFGASFSPEQVQQFLGLLRNFILYLLLDNLLSFGLILLFVLLLVNSLVGERQGRRKLAQAHEQLYQYSLQIEDQATLHERTRIAREIHDSLGHLLTTQAVLLQNVEMSLQSDSEAIQPLLHQIQQISAQALIELRQSVGLLRTDPLQGQTLQAAIAHLVEDFHHTSGVRPTWTFAVPFPSPHRIQVAVYRILEETLPTSTNTARPPKSGLSSGASPSLGSDRSSMRLCWGERIYCCKSRIMGKDFR